MYFQELYPQSAAISQKYASGVLRSYTHNQKLYHKNMCRVFSGVTHNQKLHHKNMRQVFSGIIPTIRSYIIKMCVCCFQGLYHRNVCVMCFQRLYHKHKGVRNKKYPPFFREVYRERFNRNYCRNAFVHIVPVKSLCVAAFTKHHQNRYPL